MVAQVTLSDAFSDFFCTMGLGLVLALLYDGLRLLLPEKKTAVFFADFFMITAGTVLVFSYGVSLSHSGVYRWYMAAGTLTGYGAYLKVLAPETRRLRRFLHHMLCLPFSWTRHHILKPLQNRMEQKRKALQGKKKKSAQSRRKQLQKKGKVLYNAK